MKKSLLFIIFAASFSAQAFREDPHPFMYTGAANSMHNDSYNSDVHDFPGPLNKKTKLDYFKYSRLFGLCPAFGFDSKGRVVTLCVKSLRTKLYFLDAKSLDVLGSIRLPSRKDIIPAVVSIQFDKLLKDTSGGAYFYIDHNNNIVFPSADREVLFIKVTEKSDGKVKLSIDYKYDLNDIIPHDNCPSITHPVFGSPNCDKLTAALPDWAGRFWFTTRFGRIGIIDPRFDEIKYIKIPEEIQNSFAVSKDGVYIASDHAMYRFTAGPDNVIQTEWREAYDRGTRVKPGQINKGTGTTPTLFGNRYVAISDNADPYLNALVYDRLAEKSEDRLICKVPVFSSKHGADESSFVGYGNTIVVSNSYGYKHPFTNNHPQTGMVRIDVDPETKKCSIVWKNDKVVPVSATPKFSLGSGLIYYYSQDPRKFVIGPHQWFLGGVDFNTGEIVYRTNTKKGLKYDNFWGTISIGPNHSVFVGALQGFLKISD